MFGVSVFSTTPMCIVLFGTASDLTSAVFSASWHLSSILIFGFFACYRRLIWSPEKQYVQKLDRLWSKQTAKLPSFQHKIWAVVSMRRKPLMFIVPQNNRPSNSINRENASPKITLNFFFVFHFWTSIANWTTRIVCDRDGRRRYTTNGNFAWQWPKS